MNDDIKDLNQPRTELLNAEVSDEALEAAADDPMAAAMSLGAPTVSVLFACCGTD
jgi:hypothetical protein